MCKGRNAYHGQTIGDVCADQLRLFGAAIGQNNFHALFTTHHMIIGHNVSLGVDNDSRADLLPLYGRHLQFDDGWLDLGNSGLLLGFYRRSTG
jgi:hypothetical protein